MNDRYTFTKKLFALLVAFFFSGFAFAQTPAWVLGEQPRFTGTIVDWTKGDAVAPGEAMMYGRNPFEAGSIGYGPIKSDGSFSFNLMTTITKLGYEHTPDLSMCPGAKRSNPRQKLVGVTTIDVEALYKDGVHARPGGAIVISVGRPADLSKASGSSLKAVYIFVHASSSGTLKGTCTFNGQTGSVDLDLRKGWNSVKIDPIRLSFITAAISKDAKWYFINPLTAGTP
jgi:hypothetical protein